eukprot:TRINITY_DN14545_c0_g1_i1.p3 TRINITY_DN14545_c0_g1~~TRINITY_DN14545_c0_g1_i1.p3  ORF type:complete len:159 (+),score=56.10 TRINITY_DN14545_c0_g1_i1:441-917(+)
MEESQRLLAAERSQRLRAESSAQVAEEAAAEARRSAARARGGDAGGAAVECLLRGGAADSIRGLRQRVSALEAERDALLGKARRCADAEEVALQLRRRLDAADARTRTPSPSPPPPAPTQPSQPTARPHSGAPRQRTETHVERRLAGIRRDVRAARGL